MTTKDGNCVRPGPQSAPARLEVGTWRVASAVLVFTTLLAGVSSCGSKSTPSYSAGAGSGGVAGTLSHQCAEGDTRQCIGPGACSGGQACGEDGRWGSCDCGAAGQSGDPSRAGSGGGSAGAAVAGGSSGREAGGPSDSAGESAIGGAESNAGSSGLNAGDEPCPDGAIAIDCSGQCAAGTPTCSDQCQKGVHLDPVPLGTTLIRLPSHPGLRCTCSEIGAPAAYSFGVGWPHPPAAMYHVSVPAPWSLNPASNSGCALPYVSACATLGSNAYGVNLTTSDPDAPAVNVTIELGKCPCEVEPCP